MKKFLGFTLAEVLITLGIIGVVASMTIPTLMQKKFEQETAAKLKKAYSTLSNAYTLAVQENGTPDLWNLNAQDNSQGAANILNNFSPFLHIEKNCGTSSGCFPANVYYKYLSGGNEHLYDQFTSYSKAILNDGVIIGFNVRNESCQDHRGTSLALDNICAISIVDLNGFNGPNQFGIDTFFFQISKYGIIPHGSQQETRYPFDPSCKDKSTSQGFGCASWVLYNENLDYLHCNNLSWSGPTKCQ